MPDYFFSERSQPFSPPSGPIVITGEKTAVQEVRATIEQMAEKFRSASYQHIVVPVTASKHKFFTANKGRLIHEVLAESGCTIIFPPGGKVNNAIIYGPTEKVGAGLSKTNEKAQAYQSKDLDVARAHSKAPGGAKLHARDVTRYFKQKREIQNLEREFDVEIVLPTVVDLYDLQKPCFLGITGQSLENVSKAQESIKEMYTKYNPGRVARLDVEPFHHRHIVGRDGRGPKKIIGERPVELLFPEDPEESEVVFVYEGESQEQEEIHKTLDEAKELVLNFSKNQVAIVKKTIDIPKEYEFPCLDVYLVLIGILVFMQKFWGKEALLSML